MRLVSYFKIAFISVAVAIAAFAIGIVTGPKAIEPHNGWKVPEYFLVSDLRLGLDEEGIYVEVKREILKEFSGIWTAKLFDDQGHFMCGGNGVSVYRPDSTLPDRIDLFKWWMAIDPKECVKWPLPPGCYYLVTRWIILDISQSITAISPSLCLKDMLYANQ